MANTVALDIQINSEQGQASLASLKSELKGLTAELDTLEIGTEQYIKTLQKIGGVKDELKDVREAIQLGGEGGFGAIADVGTKIAAGFEVANGVMALFGTESKEVEEALQRVQAAMGLAQGIKDLSEFGKTWQNLSGLVTTFGKSAWQALSGIQKGIATTGVGVLVVALGTLVAYWDDIKAAVTGVSEAQKELAENSKKATELEAKKLESLKNSENILKLQGKSEKQILQMKINQIDAELQKGAIQAKNQVETLKGQVATEQKWYKFMDWFSTVAFEIILLPWRTAAATIDLMILQWNTLAGALGKDTLKIETLNEKLTDLRKTASEKVSTFLFDPKKTAEDGAKEIKALEEAQLKLRNEMADFQLKIKEIDKEAADNKKEAITKETDLQNELNKKLAEQRVANIDNEREAAKAKENLDYETTKKEYETKYKGRKNLDKLLEELKLGHLNKLSEIDNEYNIKEAIAQKAKDDAKLAKEQKARDEEVKMIDANLAKKKNLLDLELSQIQNNDQLKLDLKIKSIDDEVMAETKRYEILRQNKLLTDADKEKLEQEHLAKINALSTQQDQLEEERDKIKAERQKRNYDFAISSTSQSLETIGNLVEAFAGKSEKQQKKAFEIQKAANIAKAIVDTFQGAVTAYTSQLIPGDPTSPIRGAIASALVVAAGIANIRKIEQTTFQSKTAPSGGGGGGGGGGEFAPNLSAPVTSTSTNLASIGFGGNQSPEPVKVFVTETDISNKTNKIKAIEQKASIE